MAINNRQRVKEQSSIQLRNVVEVNRSIVNDQADPQSKLDLKISMSDLKSIVIDEIRSKLLERRQFLLEEEKQLTSELESKNNQMRSAAQQLITAAMSGNDNSVILRGLTLLDNLRSFTGTTGYVMKFVREGYHTYSGSEAEPEINIQDRCVTGQLTFSRLDASGKNTFSMIINELNCKLQLPFDAALNVLADALLAINQQQQDNAKALGLVYREISELSHKADAMQSHLTKAHLLGQLNSTSDIMHIIAGATDRMLQQTAKALALPAPESKKDEDHNALEHPSARRID